MKNVVIYTTNDGIASLKLVDSILSDRKFKSCQFDIILNNISFFKKIKMLIVFLFFGSIFELFKRYKNKISIEDILLKHENCKLVKDVEKNYDFGLNVYGNKKLKLQKFKIYNFHLGSLKNQRGSFICFYKYIYDWEYIDLSFHEISEKFDVGKIFNKRTIKLSKKVKAIDILFLYLDHLDFLTESIEKIENDNFIQYKEYEKINLVPSFKKLIMLTIKYYFRKIF